MKHGDSISSKVGAVALLTSLLVAACTLPKPNAGAASGAARANVESLEPLVGGWRCATAEGRKVELAYRWVSGGSALVETFKTSSGKETLTIFHGDGPHLIATHYCGQGNQPRLRLARASEGTFEFRFQDVTNLASEDASHLGRLELKLTDGDHFAMTETYVAGGKEDATRFLCERALGSEPVHDLNRHELKTEG